VINLSSGRNAEKAVLELNSQPLWLVIQSMPVFPDRSLPCSELWFTRYFTARLIHKISQENPLIKDRLMTLSREMESDPRLNPFLRNEEMRRFVLESGLWEGADEAEAMHLQALAESFIPANNVREIKVSFEKLAELQLADGSWPWFRGMRPDFRMSLHILGGLGELALMDPSLNNTNSLEGQVIRKGVEAIDRTIYERYNRQRLALPDQEPGLTGVIIHYLYVHIPIILKKLVMSGLTGPLHNRPLSLLATIEPARSIYRSWY